MASRHARAYVALGGNLGNVLGCFRQTLACLKAREDTDVRAVSRAYRTVAVGLGEALPDYWNAVVCLETFLKPAALLEVLQGLENSMGRVRHIRWGPRTLDLDLLLYEDWQQHSAFLTLPHPRMTQRLFVLRPLAELNPQGWIPSHHISVAHALEQHPNPDAGILALCEGWDSRL